MPTKNKFIKIPEQKYNIIALKPVHRQLQMNDKKVLVLLMDGFFAILVILVPGRPEKIALISLDHMNDQVAYQGYENI